MLETSKQLKTECKDAADSNKNFTLGVCGNIF